ncbi:MAG: NAD(P)/FAD-dependent oxidoreductase [Geminicoccaceae bacterium]
MKLGRRQFTALSAATLATPMLARAETRPRVVVIGGGAGGATAARYIAKDSEGTIAVTLVEPSRTYYTCFFSNLVIGGFQEWAATAHTYDRLASDYGINVVHDRAIGIDRDARTVRLGDGGSLAYDRLVVAPGIDFVENSVPGWDLSAQGVMPHAYKAGTQTMLLKHQVETMREGGTFVMVAPPNPFRCPPGPYERISMVAHVFRQRNPTAKIIIVDPKEKFSKQALFEEGWQLHYDGMIERLPPDFVSLEEVRPDTMEVVTSDDTIRADVCNVIPAMQAGAIARETGLTDDSGWCPIVPATMQSRMDENIYMLGDATANGDMPKSAFAANSQAKVAAMALRSTLTDSKLFPARFSNTCWSLIAPDDGVKVGASYEATDEKIAKTDGFISETGEDAELRKRTYEESLGWYSGISADMFG